VHSPRSRVVPLGVFALVGALVGVLVGGCASGSGSAAAGSGASAVASAAGSGVVPSSAAPVLSTAAVPGLAVTTRTVPVTLLEKDAPVPGLGARLVMDGYVGGRERTFQGPSKDLTLVVSRALVFRRASGAADFVQQVHDKATTYFGLGTEVAPLDTAAGTGWLFRPPSCACHLANPLRLGVVQDGSRVVWLSINGPLATDKRLTALLAPDLSTAS
jgi:hypothetical protein